MARLTTVFICVLFYTWYGVRASQSCVGPDWFRCANGRCLATEFRCNGDNDCSDFSDEKDCPELFKSGRFSPPMSCTAREFRCGNGNCIPLEQFCDDVYDCYDSSDEYPGCKKNKTCTTSEFQCANGHCTPKKWVCDGEADCPDKSDELNCPIRSPGNCTLNMGFFQCTNGHCVSLNSTCNTSDDCGDGSDENKTLCERSLRQCNTTLHCSNSCQPTPQGAFCSCPPGYRQENQTCQDIDECIQNSQLCDHHCINEPGTYACICEIGYSLQLDNHTCKVSENRGDALLVFSSKTEIRGFYFSPNEVYFPIVNNLKHVVGVSLDSTYIYWSDIHEGSEAIFRAHEDGTKAEVIVTAGLGTPEDIAVDWVTTNIYFTDSLYKRIGVCTNSGSHCTIVITENTDKPRGLALHPATGQMYWSDWGDHPHISKAEMNGKSRSLMITENLGWPNGLTIDYPNARLYWVDGKSRTIESINVDGSDRRQVLHKVASHPFSIAIFEDRLFWSDWKTKSITSCNKFTGKGQKTLLKGLDDIYGIHIYHSVLKPDHHNPCNDHPCAELCLLAANFNYTCACSPNKALGNDGTSCVRLRDVSHQHLLIAAEGTFIDYYHNILGKPEMRKVFSFFDFAGGAYDPIDDTALMIDQKLKTVDRFDISSDKHESILSFTDEVIGGMAFDYLGNNLYWSDVERKTIEISSLSHWKKSILHFSEEPSTILLIPELAMMFVSFCTVSACHIDKMTMAGKYRTQIISGHLVGPRISLAFDSDTQRVFWADQGTGNLGSISLDGTNSRTHHSGLLEPASLAILGDEVFWTLYGQPRLFWSNKTNAMSRIKSWRLALPPDLEIAHLITTNYPQSSDLHICRLNNGGCSHVCIVESPQTFVCQCPPGMMLHNNTKTCIVETTCSSEEFECTDRSCIDKSRLCDGINDCHDGKDEFHCRTSPSCEPDEFQCVDSSACIPKYEVCDGISQCLDFSDEVNCLNRTCDLDMFKCKSGHCIPSLWRCDGDKDCKDGSDENANCSKKPCPKSMFTCKNKKCIDSELICNAIDDCGDISDELQCYKESSATESHGICGMSEFKCLESDQCIPMDKRCDGEQDCPKNDDEHYCSHCSGDEFACSNLNCVPRLWMCDNEDDCGDNSDEKGCDAGHWGRLWEGFTKKTVCSEFKCNVTGECLRWEFVCDGADDCYDDSDEGSSCETSCDHSSCDQICHRTPSGPVCKCRPGYRLDEDGKTCRDIDECEQNICSQMCENTRGSFECSCFKGYVLRSNRRTCKVINGSMEFITATKDDIRRMPSTLEAIEVVHKQPQVDITGLDVNVRKSLLYWSSELLGSIHEFNLDTKEHKQIENIGRPRVLSVDWITDNVYYFDTDKPQAIKACNIQETKCAIIIKLQDVGTVLSIATEPKNGFLFWAQTIFADLNRPRSEIWRSELNGDSARSLVKDGLGIVSGITSDHEREMIYWVDTALQRIERATFEGKRREIFLKDEVHRPMGINVYEDSIYWLMGNTGVMHKCLLVGNKKCKRIPVTRNNVHGLFVISHGSRQPVGTNDCESHSCDYMCVQRQGISTCICHDGSEQHPDSTCPLSNKADITFDSQTLLMQKSECFESTKSLAGPITGTFIFILLGVFMLVAYWFYQKNKSQRRNQDGLRIHFQNPSYGNGSGLPADYVVPVIPPGEHEYENPLNIHTTTVQSASIPNTKFKRTLELINSDQSDSEWTNDETGYKANLIAPWKS